MAFTQLSAMAKIALGTGLVSGSLLIAGIVWQGDEAIENVKDSLDYLKTEFTEVVADNEFLKEQLDALDGLYTATVGQSNAQLATLETERDNLFSDLNTLKNEALDLSDVDADTEVIQLEINRLESELNEANAKVAELEAYAETLESEVNYTPINQDTYTAESKELQTATIPIDNSAKTLDMERATLLADDAEIIESALASKGVVNITGISTYTRLDGTTQVSIQVEELIRPSVGYMSDEYTNWFEENISTEKTVAIVLHTEDKSGDVMAMSLAGIAYRTGGY